MSNFTYKNIFGAFLVLALFSYILLNVNLDRENAKLELQQRETQRLLKALQDLLNKTIGMRTYGVVLNNFTHFNTKFTGNIYRAYHCLKRHAHPRIEINEIFIFL